MAIGPATLDLVYHLFKRNLPHSNETRFQEHISFYILRELLGQTICWGGCFEGRSLRTNILHTRVGNVLSDGRTTGVYSKIEHAGPARVLFV
jgi:hypothetical protein